MRNKLPIISFDIDGVLNNYPICFIDYANNISSTNYQTLSDIKNNLDYKHIKHMYRLDDYKYNIQIDKIVKEIIIELFPKFQINIFTRRPFHAYNDMFQRTKNWLMNNEILFDELFYKSYENFNNKNILIHIDDENKHILPLLDCNKTQFITLDNAINEYSNVHFIKSKLFLRDKIFSLLEYKFK